MANLRSTQYYLDGLNASVSGNTFGINEEAIFAQYNGAGIKIGIIDQGFDYTHPDLSSAFNLSLSEDVRDTGTVSILPDSSTETHGTEVSGVIGADNDNDMYVGAASGAALIGFYARFGSGGSSATELGNYVDDAGSKSDVVNASWGIDASFSDNFNKSTWSGIKGFVEDHAVNGRSGLGTVYVFAVGNDRNYVSGSSVADGDDTNAHSFQSDRHIIAVAGSTSAGALDANSTSGAPILVTAPDTVINTDAPDNGDGNRANDIMSDSGTSFAAPLVSSTVALMLQANPALGARDVQEILALSSRKIDMTNASWSANADTHWNGGGNIASNDFGFGLVDARAAVRLAETWSGQHTFGNESDIHAASSASGGGSDVFSHNASKSYTINVSSTYAGFSIDHVDLKIDLGTVNTPGDLVITLTSPGGTVTTLLNQIHAGSTGVGFHDPITLDSTHFWGEAAVGNWTVAFADANSNANTYTVSSAAIDVYGDTQGVNDTYFYTDQLSDYNSGGRLTLTDSNGGTDKINLAAVSSAVTIDLVAGHTSTIDGQTLTIGGSTTIENVLGTDQNDTITGNSADNLIIGGRGADTMAGGTGNDGYVVDNASDVVTEGTAAGTDTIYTKVSYTLSSNVENMDTFGGFGIVGTGNSMDNIMAAESTATTTTFYGLAGDDVLFGATTGGETLDGGDGNDTIWGDGGGDSMLGGNGNNNLHGSTGNDLFYGGTGTTYMYGNSGAGSGNDQFYGSSGTDLMVGGAGNDYMAGNGSQDWFYGEGGNDYLIGGAGNDVFVFDNASFGVDTIDDFTPGTDTVVFSSSIFADYAAVQAGMSADGVGGTLITPNGTDYVHVAVLAAAMHSSDFAFI